MADTAEHPFFKARPPATDALTYLTLIEYNLTAESLPVLHEVLRQDAELTRNIGWDLVHLLVPLLPASKDVLRDIASSGNPREVVIKVVESLRFLDFQEVVNDAEEDEDKSSESGKAAQTDRSTIGNEPNSSKNTSEASIRCETTKSKTTDDPSLPLPILQYEVLLSLLEILHPRIKTKYPSRFLSSTLQAVLATYTTAAESTSHLDELTAANVRLVNTLSGTKRPQLPPRVSSGHLPTLAKRRPEDQRLEPLSSTSKKTGDGVTKSTTESNKQGVEGDDSKIYERLLQSFLTHVLEHYLSSLSHDEDVPGLAWSNRLQEKMDPRRVVPGKTSYAERFASDEVLHGRIATVGQMVALAQDIGLRNDTLITTLLEEKGDAAPRSAFTDQEEDPPTEAKDVPLSSAGALYLLTARKVAAILYKSPGIQPSVPIFPQQAVILRSLVDVESPTIGSEPEALLDSLLTLGLLATYTNDAGEPKDAEEFRKYLLTIALISANSPSPSLRYNAHVLTSTLLRSHPDDMLRFNFIHDTLEHCPYENLKASAVGWLKGETIEANPPSSLSGDTRSQHDHEDHSVFSTPIALSTMSPFIFPDLTADLLLAPISDAWTHFKMNLSFYLATLNFYYLLLSAKHLHQPLGIQALHTDADVAGSFLAPLKNASKRFREGLEEGGELYDKEGGEEDVQMGRAELGILDEVVGRVEVGIVGLN